MALSVPFLCPGLPSNDTPTSVSGPRSLEPQNQAKPFLGGSSLVLLFSPSVRPMPTFPVGHLPWLRGHKWGKPFSIHFPQLPPPGLSQTLGFVLPPSHPGSLLLGEPWGDASCFPSLSQPSPLPTKGLRPRAPGRPSERTTVSSLLSAHAGQALH